VPINYYPNATEAELVAMAASLQRRMTVGEVQFMTQPGGGQVQKSFQNTPEAKQTLKDILYSLHRKNPSVYDNPYTQRIKRTLPNYVNA
jgi:hypothetical protein